MVRVGGSRSAHWRSSSLSNCCCFRRGETSSGFEWEGSAALELKELEELEELEEDRPASYPLDPLGDVSNVTGLDLDLIASLLGGWSPAGGMIECPVVVVSWCGHGSPELTGTMSWVLQGELGPQSPAVQSRPHCWRTGW
jgi:hypothetical protein